MVVFLGGRSYQKSSGVRKGRGRTQAELPRPPAKVKARHLKAEMKERRLEDGKGGAGLDFWGAEKTPNFWVCFCFVGRLFGLVKLDLGLFFALFLIFSFFGGGQGGKGEGVGLHAPAPCSWPWLLVLPRVCASPSL